MSITINIPEWFGWIAVAFAFIYAVAMSVDSYWKWYELRWQRKQESTDRGQI